MARQTVAACVERFRRLYEQGADSLRIGNYVRHRWNFVRSGFGGFDYHSIIDSAADAIEILR